MDAKKFSFFKSYGDAFEYLSDEQAGILVKAMCRFVFEGVHPEFEDMNLNMVWKLIEPNLLASIERTTTGKKGAKSKKDIS